MSSIGKSISSVLILCQLVFSSATARADDPAAAEVLFLEGRRLIAEGQVTAACEKLKESFALDAMSGTLLNLADCYEKAGKTATAWARFRNAASLAKNQGKAEQVAEANRRAKSLESELSYLKIVVVDPVPGLEVRRNDMEVTAATLGVEVPVDPGRVEVVASAPGYKSARQTVEVGARRDRLTVTIPKLTPSDKAVPDKDPPAPALAPPSEPTPAPPEEEPKQQPDPPKVEPPAQKSLPPAVEAGTTGGPGVVPWIIGGFGVAALATGGVFGYLAIQSDKEANDLCPARQQCTKKTLNTADLRDQRAVVANIGMGVGIAAVATATVWLLLDRPKSHSDDRVALTVQPAVTRDMAALWASGRF